MKKKLKDAHERNGRYRDTNKTLKDRLKDLEEKEQQKEDKIKDLERRNKELEDTLKKMAEAKQSKAPKIPDYSLERHQLSRKTKSLNRGKRTTKTSRESEVTREENVYPQGFNPSDCFLFRTRIIVRIEKGKKEVIRYQIYRAKTGRNENGPIGKVPGVVAKSDYGMEVGIIVAFLVNEIGLSYGKTRQVLHFFCGLEIAESQIENLIKQVSKQWEGAYESILNLMLYATVVYVDETGWKVGKDRRYTWIFESLTHTLLRYGEKREESILDQVLPLKKFEGIVVSDCYSMYCQRFRGAQKCWAHFLRKIIKLHLLNPEEKEYQPFLENLGRRFSEAKKVKNREGPYQNWSDTKRAHFAKQQTKRVVSLCTRREEKLSKHTEKSHREFVNLQKSLVKNQADLFTFITEEGVEPTNNRAERGLRKTAALRNNYQTSKTKSGADRRSIIASVFASLKQHLPNFSLQTVLVETNLWLAEDVSLFERQLDIIRV